MKFRTVGAELIQADRWHDDITFHDHAKRT